MSSLEKERIIPHKWEESVIVRHLNDPYSFEALAEPRKSWLEVGSVDFDSLPLAEPYTFPLRPLKQPGKDFEPLAQLQQYREVHTLFTEAARLILGSRFLDCRIFFDHLSTPLYAGQTHSFSSPHMDGTLPGGVNVEQKNTTGCSDLGLKLIGAAMNAVPSAVLQGPAEPDDFEGETLTHLRSSAWREKDFIKEELPLNTLVLMAPSTIHYAQQAPHNIKMRHFLRWQLFA